MSVSRSLDESMGLASLGVDLHASASVSSPGSSGSRHIYIPGRLVSLSTAATQTDPESEATHSSSQTDLTVEEGERVVVLPGHTKIG